MRIDSAVKRCFLGRNGPFKSKTMQTAVCVCARPVVEQFECRVYSWSVNSGNISRRGKGYPGPINRIRVLRGPSQCGVTLLHLFGETEKFLEHKFHIIRILNLL